MTRRLRRDRAGHRKIVGAAGFSHGMLGRAEADSGVGSICWGRRARGGQTVGDGGVGEGRSAGQSLPMGDGECGCGRLGRMSDARIFSRTHFNERDISRGLE